LTSRAVRRKLASGSKRISTRKRVFVHPLLAAESLQENTFACDELAAERGVYAYVGENPTTYTDPSGEFFQFLVVPIVVGVTQGVVEAATTLATGQGAAAAGEQFVDGFAGGFVTGLLGQFAPVSAIGALAVAGVDIAIESALGSREVIDIVSPADGAVLPGSPGAPSSSGGSVCQ
jgi:hypothetical protein